MSNKYESDEATFLRRLAEHRVFSGEAKERLQEMAAAAEARKAAYVRWHIAVQQGIAAIDLPIAKDKLPAKTAAKKMLLSALHDAEKVLT